MTIVPGFYLHKWEMKQGRLTLMIEVPKDVTDQIRDSSISLHPRSQADIDAYNGPITDKVGQ